MLFQNDIARIVPRQHDNQRRACLCSFATGSCGRDGGLWRGKEWCGSPWSHNKNLGPKWTRRANGTSGPGGADGPGVPFVALRAGGRGGLLAGAGVRCAGMLVAGAGVGRAREFVHEVGPPDVGERDGVDCITVEGPQADGAAAIVRRVGRVDLGADDVAVEGLLVAAGDHREPRVPHRALGRALAAHQRHRLGRRADEGHAVLRAHRREQRVLRQEAPAGVERRAAGLHRGLHDAAHVEVRLRGAGRAEHDHLAIAGVRRVAVGLRHGEHRGDAERVAGAGDPDGNLAAVGDQDAMEQRRTHGRARGATLPRAPHAPASARAINRRHAVASAARSPATAATAAGPLASRHRPSAAAA